MVLAVVVAERVSQRSVVARWDDQMSPHDLGRAAKRQAFSWLTRVDPVLAERWRLEHRETLARQGLWLGPGEHDPLQAARHRVAAFAAQISAPPEAYLPEYAPPNGGWPTIAFDDGAWVWIAYDQQRVVHREEFEHVDDVVRRAVLNVVALTIWAEEQRYRTVLDPRSRALREMALLDQGGPAAAARRRAERET